mgnify:FL=1|jgi:hypothetical protein
MALTKVTNPLLSASGTADATTYLRGDGAWSTISQGTFPFAKADGTSDPINLTSNQEVPFTKADGSSDNIALII